MEAGAVSRSAAVGGPRGLSPGWLRLASDNRLVALTREGRTVAFEVAYDRHYRAILSFCRHMLGDLEEAQDAVQHTFLSAYNALLASDKPIHLRAWLFTIARNRCYSILRARREAPSGDLSDALTEGLATQVQRRQDLRDLVRDMQQLPGEQRAALVLAELDSLTHEQIAEVLDVPKGKVKALVFQARESLIASRTARETDCHEIREQLATLRGGSLRRSNIRRHLRQCSGCREFRNQVERQRRQLAVLLPMAPGIAAKELILTGSAAGGAAAAAGGGTLLAFKGGLLKAALGTALAGIGTAGTLEVTTAIHTSTTHGGPKIAAVTHHGSPGNARHGHMHRHASSPAPARITTPSTPAAPHFVSLRHFTHRRAHAAWSSPADTSHTSHRLTRRQRFLTAIAARHRKRRRVGGHRTSTWVVAALAGRQTKSRGATRRHTKAPAAGRSRRPSATVYSASAQAFHEEERLHGESPTIAGRTGRRNHRRSARHWTRHRSGAHRAGRAGGHRRHRSRAR